LVDFNLGKQFCFSLVGPIPEGAQQIQSVRAITTHHLGQLVLLGHLKNTIELIPRYSRFTPFRKRADESSAFETGVHQSTPEPKDLKTDALYA